MFFENNIIGRKSEIERLNRCMREEAPQLIVVYGRRRVGKTFLINQYFNGRFDFKLTGVYQARKELQLENFVNELNRQSGTEYGVPESWTKAFLLLRNYLEDLSYDQKRVVFLDEMPWMETQRSDFLSAFEFFWNDYGCTRNNLVVIVCGSATSWMQKKIVENKGGLFNRQTCNLFLAPFNLRETEDYLLSRGIEWARYEIAVCYMILGGIPFYLRQLDPELSMNGNIDNLFFRKRAVLWDEFDHLYRTLFSNSNQYIRVVEILGAKRTGMTRGELVLEAGLSDNSSLTEMLNDLTASGFLRAYNFYGKKKRETRYQVSDYYTLFYLRFLKGRPGHDEHFWSNSYDNPARRSWAGLTFEQLCKDHVSEIKKKLGILGVVSDESSWFTRADEDRGIPAGAQIDMIIDRRDHVTNICEIKFTDHEYTISKEDDIALRNKIDAFRKITCTKKTLSLTMITSFGIKNNKYSGIVSSQVTLDDLFSE